MSIQIYQGHDVKPAADVAVIIDVLRAFSTSFYLLNSGAKEVQMCNDQEAMFKIAENNPQAVLIGEINGYKIEGFDHGNSPLEISKNNYSGKTPILKTSNGVKGVFNCLESKEIFVTGLLGIDHLIGYLKRCHRENKSIAILASHPSSDDDMAIAEYIQDQILEKDSIKKNNVIERIRQSLSAEKFNDPDQEYFNAVDLEYCLELPNDENPHQERPFVMRVFYNEGDIAIIKPHFL